MDIFNKDSVLKNANRLGWEALRKEAEESLKAMEAAYEKEKKEKAEAAAKRQFAETDLLTAFNNYRKALKTSVDEAIDEFLYLLDEAIVKDPKKWDEPQILYSTSKSKTEMDKEKQRCEKLKKEIDKLIFDATKSVKNENDNSNSKNTKCGGAGVSSSNENLADVLDHFFRFI